MKKQKEKAQQLNLGLKTPFSNFIYYISYKISNSFRVFDLMKLAKDSTVWLLNTASVFLIVLQIYILLTKYNRLPSLLPLINYYNIDSMRLVQREYMYIIPTLSFVSLIISFVLGYKWFNREKELIKILLLITTLSIIVLTIHLLKTIAIY